MIEADTAYPGFESDLNRPLRSGRKGRQEEIFAFRWKGAEGKRLAA
jgi:hypothetical protein